MVNETFSAQRFGKYFKFDLKQLWHNNGKAVIGLGFLSVICYLLWLLVSLVFTGEWNTPSVAARIAFFYLGSVVLVLYQTRIYGYLTEKKAGQSWLMMPASSLEKFISMMIIALVVIPLAYIVSYLALDTVIGFVDKTTGGPILAGYKDVAATVNRGLSAASDEGFQFNLGLFTVPVVLQLISNILYFLLCGISFKKWKILGGFAILIALSSVLTPLFSSLVFKYWTPALAQYDYAADPGQMASLMNQVFNFATILNIVLVLLFAAGIYYRIKTLKH